MPGLTSEYDPEPLSLVESQRVVAERGSTPTLPVLEAAGPAQAPAVPWTEASMPCPALLVLAGADAGRLLLVPAGPLTIGRSPAADLSVDDPRVSRLHACVSWRRGDEVIVEDLGSCNGTFVDGARVRSAVLRSGTQVRCGPSLALRFAWVSAAEREVLEHMYESSVRDPLTHVFNRRYVETRLRAELCHARRHRVPLSVLAFDLDGFKRVNDEHGHAAGDAVLRAVAQHVMRAVRTEDVVARYGGDEFVVVARSTSVADAARLAERIRATVEQTQAAAARVSATIGVAGTDDGTADLHDLLALADARLYRAKAMGKNRVDSGEGGPVSQIRP